MHRTHHTDGTSARQLDLVLIGDLNVPIRPTQPTAVQARLDVPRRPLPLRLMQKDVYAELNRRRRRAQIAARHLL